MTHHPQVQASRALVDEGMAPLLELLWERGKSLCAGRGTLSQRHARKEIHEVRIRHHRCTCIGH